MLSNAVRLLPPLALLLLLALAPEPPPTLPEPIPREPAPVVQIIPPLDESKERFQAADTGVAGAWVDIYTPDYGYAVQRGRQTLAVYWMEPEVER